MFSACEDSKKDAALSDAELFDALLSGEIESAEFEWRDPDLAPEEIVPTEDGIEEHPVNLDEDSFEEGTEALPENSPEEALEDELDEVLDEEFAEEDIILCQDGNENCAPQPNCKCAKGAFTFNAKVDKKFSTHPLTRSPKPLSPTPQTMGPCVGTYGVKPAGKPVQNKFKVGNTFFISFPLNGKHGCSSEQAFVEWKYTIDSKTKKLLDVKFERGKDGPPPPGKGQNFFGDTKTGIRKLDGKFAYYEGTTKNLSWWDGAGTRGTVIPAAVKTQIQIRVLKLLSAVKNSDGTYCKCYSTHVFAVNSGVGVASTKQLKPLLDEKLLKGLQKEIYDKVLKGTKNKKSAQQYSQGMKELQDLSAKVLKQHPYFAGECK